MSLEREFIHSFYDLRSLAKGSFHIAVITHPFTALLRQIFPAGSDFLHVEVDVFSSLPFHFQSLRCLFGRPESVRYDSNPLTGGEHERSNLLGHPEASGCGGQGDVDSSREQELGSRRFRMQSHGGLCRA